MASKMLVLPDLHTHEWTMNELLELKMSAVPEMEPNKTSEHNGLKGLSLCDFLRCFTCSVSILVLFILHSNAFTIHTSRVFVHFLVPNLIGDSQLGASLLEIKEKLQLKSLQLCFLAFLGMPCRCTFPLKKF